jgi:hypothetical protein
MWASGKAGVALLSHGWAGPFFFLAVTFYELNLVFNSYFEGLTPVHLYLE